MINEELAIAIETLDEWREQILATCADIEDEDIKEDLLDDALDALVVSHYLKKLAAQRVPVTIDAYQVLMSVNDMADRILDAVIETILEDAS